MCYEFGGTCSTERAEVRKREQIIQSTASTEILTLEVLLDIRELLQKKTKKAQVRKRTLQAPKNKNGGKQWDNK